MTDGRVLASDDNPRCEACVYFVEDAHARHGECLRHAPAARDDQGTTTCWPMVSGGDVCGDGMFRRHYADGVECVPYLRALEIAERMR